MKLNKIKIIIINLMISSKFRINNLEIDIVYLSFFYNLILKLNLFL